MIRTMDAERIRGSESNVIPYKEFLRASRLAGLSRTDTSGPGGEEQPEPTDDQARLRVVRERVRSGYYDRPEILEQIVERILGFLAPDDGCWPRRGA